MQPLEEWLAGQDVTDIEVLTSYIQQYIAERWRMVLQENQRQLRRLFEQVSEGAAYGSYAVKLFRPIKEQLLQAGFHSEPGFPGTLATSLEWGPAEERERWMWCVVKYAQGAPLGATVIRLVHDHTRFRLPHPPGILAVRETETNAIIRAVAQAAGYPASVAE